MVGMAAVYIPPSAGAVAACDIIRSAVAKLQTHFQRFNSKIKCCICWMQTSEMCTSALRKLKELYHMEPKSTSTHFIQSQDISEREEVLIWFMWFWRCESSHYSATNWAAKVVLIVRDLYGVLYLWTRISVSNTQRLAAWMTGREKITTNYNNFISFWGLKKALLKLFLVRKDRMVWAVAELWMLSCFKALKVICVSVKLLK